MSTHLEGVRAPLGFKIALLGLILVALMGVGASSAMAAAPTLEPVVSAQPDDPNTTNLRNNFTVNVDPAETETITQIQCRLDPTVATSWGYCLSAAGGNYQRTNLSNGLHEIQFRTLNAEGAGPATSITWTVATPAPTLPPVITAQPDNPNASTTSQFKQNIDPAESDIVGNMECSLDGADWSGCGATVNYYPGNGDHTFKTRATNVSGISPVVEVNWTVDVPDVLSDAIPVDDIASTRWDGPLVNSSIGQASPGAGASVNAGDVNGDGVNDLVIPNQRYGDSNAQIIFGNGKALGGKTMTGIGPNKGYKLAMDNPSVPLNIGDQNGDGLDDMAIGASGDTFFYVVYGISDPSALPRCEGGPDRCLDLATMSTSQGYEVTSTAGIMTIGSSDFDGDGMQDLAVGSEDVAFVLKGKERSGNVDLDTAVGVDAIKMTGPTGIQFGAFAGGISDLNADGKDEVAVIGGLFSGGGLYVITGRSLENVSAPINVAPLNPADGFYIATAPLGIPQATNIGDMNGDGRDDLMLGYINLGAATAGQVSIVYMPELPTSDPVLAGDDLEPGNGYVLNPGGAAAALGLQQASVGDIDGDGLDDQLLGATATPSNGFANPGAAYLIKGQAPGITSPIGLGPEFNPDLGVAIVSGKARSGSFGSVPTNMGDLDGDGLPDFVIGASGESNNGVNSSGSIYVIPGRNLMARATTAGSTVVSDTKATINGQVGTNGRATDYQFEYGTTDEYGSTTDSVSLPAGGSTPVNVDLSGLAPNTKYHYRLVVTNDLGLTRYGADQTFTTAATPPKEGCAADSTKPGCDDYNYCKANPTKSECKAPVAKLSGVIVSVESSKVKRGKKTTAKVTVVNTGTAAASGLKICLKAPKKFVKGARCIKVGSLGAGKSATRKFKVTVKKNAKKGKKVALKFTASANHVKATSGKSAVKIK